MRAFGPLVRDIAAPLAAFVAVVMAWEGAVWAFSIAPFVLPAPTIIVRTLVDDWPMLSDALMTTLGVTLKALALAILGGVGLALLFAHSKWVERALLPFAVIVQVTPVIAIAPLLLIWMEPETAVLVSAFLVAFFPILANTSMGLASTDRGLVDLFALCHASRGRTLWRLKLPAALPYFMSGLRIGGGLALVGAIVAELAAGASGKGAGLAFRITEAGYRLNIPRMFAALALVSAAGLVLYGALAGLSWITLRRWHESARGAER